MVEPYRVPPVELNFLLMHFRASGEKCPESYSQCKSKGLKNFLDDTIKQENKSPFLSGLLIALASRNVTSNAKC